jgi:hypothetical protein
MLPEKKYLASGSAPESLTPPRGARFSRVRPSSSGVASSSQSRHSARVSWRSLAAFRRRSSSGWQRNGGWKCGCWRVSPTPGWYDARQAGRLERRRQIRGSRISSSAPCASRDEGAPGGVRRRRCASEGAARGRALLWRRRNCSGPAKKIPVFCVTVPGARHVTAFGHSTVLLLQDVEGGIPGGPLAVPACPPLALDVLVSEVEDHRTYGNPYGTDRAADHRTTAASRSAFSLLHCANSTLAPSTIYEEERAMESALLDVCGRRRSPATLPGYHSGRPPMNKGLRYPADQRGPQFDRKRSRPDAGRDPGAPR